jgi:hypothetical protein
MYQGTRDPPFLYPAFLMKIAPAGAVNTVRNAD